MTAENSIFNLARVWRAFGYSLAGLRSAWRQTVFRQEVALSVVLVPLGVWLGKTGIERALLAGSILLIPMVELLNSAVEAAIDRISRKRHELSGQAKDLGSAAVLVACVIALVTWTLILWPSVFP